METNRSIDLEYPECYDFMFTEDLSHLRHLVLAGGRGSGKSHVIALYLLIEGMKSPHRILCAREIQKSIQESVHQDLAKIIRALNLEWFYRITEKKIFGANGTEFFFSGLRHNMGNIKSISGISICWVEECSYVSNQSLELLIPSIRGSGDPNVGHQDGRLIYSYNPHLKDDPIHAMFVNVDDDPDWTPPRKSKYLHTTYFDNPFCPQSLIDNANDDKERDYELYQHKWLGQIWNRSDALVFLPKSDKTPRGWIIEDLDDRFNLDTATPYLGADWGFSSDPTCIVESYISGTTLYIANEASAVRCPIDGIPALFAGHDPKERWVNPKNYPGLESARRQKIMITADSSGPDIIDFLVKKGFKIRPSIKG